MPLPGETSPPWPASRAFPNHPRLPKSFIEQKIKSSITIEPLRQTHPITDTMPANTELVNAAKRSIQNNVAILVFLLFIPVALAYSPFKVDDAFISFVYSKNLVQGHGLTYNGMIVEGYSNFLWVISIAPWIGLGWDPMGAARVISLGCAGLALFTTEKIIRRLIPGLGMQERALSLLVVAVSAPFAAWTMGGLETVFMSLWVILFVYCEIRADVRAQRWSMFIVLIGALVRPEGVLLFFLLITHRLLFKTQSYSKILRQSLIFLLPYAAFLLWRYSYYGYWVPNTAYLKINPGLQVFRDAVAWLGSYWLIRPVFSLLVLVGLVEIVRKKIFIDHGWSLIGGVILSNFAFVIYSGPDWMPFHRFLVPALLLLSLLVGRVFVIWGHRLIHRLVLATALTAVALEVVTGAMIYIPFTPQFGNYTDGLIRGGSWIRQYTQPTDTIAVADAGALAYYSERRVIDFGGLNDVVIAHSPSEQDTAYVLGQRPQIIQLHLEVSPSYDILLPSRPDQNTEIFHRPDFQALYKPYREGLIDPYFPLFFIRNPPQSSAE